VGGADMSEIIGAIVLGLFISVATVCAIVVAWMINYLRKDD
jgi:hypothetical protein